VTPARQAHVEGVVALVTSWAEAMSLSPVERDRWSRAAWLHDALRDAPEAELRRLVPDEPGPIELLHGPAAAVRAAADGEEDSGVLSAVRWHSVGSAHWDRVGQVLYCADFLEPGRNFDREGRAALAARFPSAVDEVVREVAARRVAWLVRSGWFIPETTWRFWNHVAGGWPM
jgi:2-amino-4-hydroxy-6-hydroxymethyldihydropteridine diphosphokinase